jgi:hypothetical protein
MALVLADRVRETTTTTGTGTVTLAGPVSGFQGFNAAIGNANTTYYTIADAATGAWEVGLGTYTSAGSTLARTTILSSSNSGAAVNFAAGTKDVFVTQPAERALYLNGAGTGVDAGAAAFTANGVVYASSTSALATGSAFTFNGTALAVTTVDATNLEATNVKALDGTSAFTIASATGIVSIDDTKFTLQDNADNTKKALFELSGITTATTRTYTLPNLTGSLATIGTLTQTFSGTTTFSAATVTVGSSTAASTYGLGSGATISAATKTINIGTAGVSNSTTNINYGSAVSGALGTHIWNIGGEQMRLTSTGLGIGTSSPAAKIDVSQSQNGQTAVQITNSNAGASAEATFIASNGTYIGSFGVAGVSKSTFGAILASDAYIYSNANVANTGITLMANSANGVIKFATGGSAEKMRLDSAGNLGLGVTPSDWNSGYKTFQVNTQASLAASSSAVYLANNFYQDSGGTNRYIATGTAGVAGWEGNIFRWYQAASGSAGAAQTTTNSMTLDASGNLGIGATSPGAKLEVVVSGSSQQLRLVSTGNSIFRTRWIDATAGFAMESQNSTESAYYPYTLTGSVLRFNTGGGSLAATLDSAGNLGLGTAALTLATGLSLFKYGTQWTNHLTNTYPQPAGNTFLQMEAVAGQTNWFGFTGSYGATSGSANLLLQVNLNNISQQAGNYIASEAQSAIAADLTFGKMIGGATTGANSTKSEQMRLLSNGNFGIGTASPTQKLDVAGSARIVETGTPSGDAALQISVDGVNARTIRMTDTASSGRTYDFINRAQGVAGNFGFFDNTAGAYRYIIDSAGNLGLGVTPSAWSSAFKALQISNTVISNNGATDSFFGANYFFDGSNNRYLSAAHAAAYGQVDGAHLWFSAPAWNGTGSDIVSFTQAMTLDASGNLGVGTTNPIYDLQVGSYGVSADSTLALASTTTGTGTIRFGDGTAGVDANAGQIQYVHTDNAMTFSTLATERARIDSAGNLGLGVTPSAWSGYKGIQVKNASLTSFNSESATLSQNAFFDGTQWKYISTDEASQYEQFNGGHTWFTASSGTAGGAVTFTQPMTLKSTGDFLLGPTSLDTTNGGFIVTGTTASTSIELGHISGSSSGSYYAVFTYDGNLIGSITQSGTTAVLYNTTSDYRLKTVIGPVTDAGQRIDALQPVEYTWNASGERTRGFLAHQFQEVYAGSVSGTKDAADAEGKPVYQSMQASTSEVIADLVAELQSLRARVAALEAA